MRRHDRDRHGGQPHLRRDRESTVIATGSNGGVARDTPAVTVGKNVSTDQPPVPDVTMTESNATHVRLDASGSVDLDGTVRGFAWDTDGDGIFDWEQDTYTVYVEDLGTTRTHTGEFRAGVNVESVQIANRNIDSWASGSNFHMWVGDGTFEDAAEN